MKDETLQEEGEGEGQGIAATIDEIKSKTQIDIVTNKLFVFYMIIAANFLAVVFSCDVQRMLTKNIYAIHLVAIMTMYFSVVLVDSTENKKTNPMMNVIWTSSLYLVFLLSTHCHFKWFFSAIIVMFTVFFFQSIKTFVQDILEDDTHKAHKIPGASRVLYLVMKTIEYAQLSVQFVIASLIVIGFMVYTGEQSVKFGDGWNWKQYWFETPCNIKRTGELGYKLVDKYKHSGLALAGLKRVFGMSSGLKMIKA